MTRSKHPARPILTVGAAVAVVLVGSPPVAAHHDEIVDKLDRGIVERVSVSSSGDRGDGDSGGSGCGGSWYSASDSGRFIVFASKAGDLVPADTNGTLIQDVFSHDRKTNRTELVSVMPTGLAPSMPAGVPAVSTCVAYSTSPVISNNGRYVAFISTLPLTGADEPQTAAPISNLFVHDRKKGTTELVRTLDGTPPNRIGGVMPGLSISDDGRRVAFWSWASNFVEGTCPASTIPTAEILLQLCPAQGYVWDRKTKEIVLASASSAGEPGDDDVRSISISGNGRFVSFNSWAGNLVKEDSSPCLTPGGPWRQLAGPTSCLNVFVNDLSTKKTELVSKSRDGRGGNGYSDSESISDDGRFVAFDSYATDLVPANRVSIEPNCWRETYVRDRQTGRTERASVTSAGTILNGAGSISDDGRYVWMSGGSLDQGCWPDLVDEHYFWGGFLHDRKTGQVDWVSFGRSGAGRTPPPSANLLGSLGGTANFIVGSARNKDVIENDTSDIYDVFLRTIGSYDWGLGLGPLSSFSSDASSSGASSSGGTILLPRDITIDNSGVAALPDGAGIVNVKVVYRSELRDLYVRVDVDRLPTPSTRSGVLPSPVVYGLKIETGERTYELRAQGFGGAPDQGGGVFELFDCTAGECTQIARISGGYGTVGESVVAAIPLRALGLERGGKLTALQAFSALGPLRLGPNPTTRFLDAVRI